MGPCRSPLVSIVGLACGLIAASAHATPIHIVNPSFESQVLADGAQTFGFGSVQGWITVRGGVANPVEGVQVVSVPDGQNIAYTGSDCIGGCSLGQILDENLTADTLYTLQVDVAGALHCCIDPMPRFTIAMNGSLSGNLALTVNPIVLQPGVFQTVVLTFLSPALDPPADDKMIIFMGQTDFSLTGLPQLVLYDNVRLDAIQVPEPSSAALLLLGCVVVARVRLRKRS